MHFSTTSSPGSKVEHEKGEKMRGIILSEELINVSIIIEYEGEKNGVGTDRAP